MPDDRNITGTCLCGAVNITVTADHTDVGICHCNMCRRWGGGPAMGIEAVKASDIDIAGQDSIATYRSSEWAERAFCGICGTNLYYRLVEADEYSVCAGIFDDADRFVLTMQIFIDEKPAFYTFANETKNLTGDEVFALFAPPDSKT